MLNGYSILLGEYIEASYIEHGDCEPFQIVCPSCYEPLFKVERSIPKIHYLSHYKQSNSNDAECERRVSSKSKSDITSHNIISRNQRLQYFLEVFKKALERDPLVSYTDSLEYSHKKINSSKALVSLRKKHYDTAKIEGLGEQGKFREFAEFYVEESRQFGDFPITGFSISTQIRIASDLMQLLTTTQGESNYNALFNHSILYLLQRCQKKPINTNSNNIHVTQKIEYFLSALMKASSEEKGMQIIGEMLHSPIFPPYVERPSSYFLKVISEIAHEMIGTLVRLPYFNMLKEIEK